MGTKHVLAVDPSPSDVREGRGRTGRLRQHRQELVTLEETNRTLSSLRNEMYGFWRQGDPNAAGCAEFPTATVRPFGACALLL